MVKTIALIILPLVFVCAVVFLLFLDDSMQRDVSKEILSSFESASTEIHEFLYDRELIINGARDIEEWVQVSLPNDNGNFWWLLNSKEIEATLRLNPRVETADVMRCDPMGFSCWRIDIILKSASWVAERDGELWILDNNGSFIGRATKHEISSSRKDVKVLSGLFDGVSSSDIIRARMKFLRVAVPKIEREVKSRLESLRILPSGEFLGKFECCSFKARFSGGFENVEKLEDEGRRLKTLLERVDGGLGGVDLVDLSYEKIAVLSPREGASLKADSPEKKELLAK